MKKFKVGDIVVLREDDEDLELVSCPLGLCHPRLVKRSLKTPITAYKTYDQKYSPL